MFHESPVSRNIPLFIAFRVFFNVRWCYPAAALAQRLVARYSMATNFAVTAGLTVLGLAHAVPSWHRWGLVAIVPLDLAMAMIGFFLSHYLNQLVVDSAQRATVLSFKGLALNLAYGAVGLLFAAYSRADAHAGSPDAIFRTHCAGCRGSS